MLVILKNGDRSFKVSAVLDEASTKTYINANVATGLHVKTEKVTVNVLNGQNEMFITSLINTELMSVDGKVNKSPHSRQTELREVCLS